MILMLASCGEESITPGGGREIEPGPNWQFEQVYYNISFDSQSVELSPILPNPGDLSVPQHCDWLEVRVDIYTEYYPGITVGELKNTLVENDARRISDLVTYKQYLNDAGQLILNVTVPQNETEYYLVYCLYLHEGNCFTFAQIIQAPRELDEIRTMNIRVDGEIYTSAYEIDKDGNYVFSDSEFSKMLAYCEDNDSLEMVVLESDIVDYIDPAREDLEAYLESVIQSSGKQQVTRADEGGFQYMTSTDIAYFGLFCDANYKGDYLSYNLVNNWNSYNLPNLDTWKKNDKLSSIAVGYNAKETKYCAILTVWEDADFNYGDNSRSKHRLSIIASYWNPKVTISNLKNVKLINSSKNWNDRISCISGHIGYWGRSMLDY